MHCCDPRFFGGIGIGQMPDFCHTCGVEAQMTACHCHNRCNCGRSGMARSDRDNDCTCGYTTTDCRQSRCDHCD